MVVERREMEKRTRERDEDDRDCCMMNVCGLVWVVEVLCAVDARCDIFAVKSLLFVQSVLRVDDREWNCFRENSPCYLYVDDELWNRPRWFSNLVFT